jgi:hypothetical protein
MYYVMESRAGDKDPARIGVYPIIPSKTIREMVIWIAGRRFNREIPKPLEFEIDPAFGRDMPDLFKPQIPLFSNRLLAALVSLGVDNLDTYDARIRDPRDGQVYNNYKAVNIVGLISCANMEKSDFDKSHPARQIAVPFNKLVIDEAKTGGSLLFRLGESAATILVHEKVKEALEPQNFSMLVFIPIDQWSN